MHGISAATSRNIRLTAVCAVLLICTFPGQAQTEPQKQWSVPLPQPGAAAQPAALPLIDPSPAFEYVNSFGGTITTAAVSGTLGLVDEGGDLVVLDLHDPAHPTRRASTPLAAGAIAIQITGTLAFVAGGTGIQAFDIADPDLPRLVGQYRAERPGGRLEIIDQLAYLFLDTDNLEIIDISDPSHLVRKAHISLPFDGYGEYGMSVTDGTLLYTASAKHRLRILDISEPSTPRPVYVGPAQPSETGCDYMARYGKQVFVNCYDGVTIYDVSDPQDVQIQGRVALSYPSELWASSKRLYVRNPETPTLDIIDITDPVHPVTLGSVPVPDDIVQATGDLLYIMQVGANLENGSTGQLEIVDITNPASPLTLGTYRPFPLPFSTRLKMAGTLAFLTNEYDGGTQILDVTDPLSPTLRGTIPEARAVQIVGQLAYVVNYTGLRIYDISDPDAPQLRGSVTTSFAAVQVVVAGERAYVLGKEYVVCEYCNMTVAHLTIVDVHDPTVPTILGTLDPVGGEGYSPSGDVMAIRGTTLYVLAERNLYIVDVSNPSAPAIRKTLGGAAEIQIDGMYAYTASNSQGLTVFDISTPENPTVIGTASTGLNFVDRLAVSNGLAFLSLSGPTGGLRVIDATRPRAPQLRGSYPRAAADIEVVGDVIYFLNGPLQILRVKPSGFTNPAYMPLTYR